MVLSNSSPALASIARDMCPLGVQSTAQRSHWDGRLSSSNSTRCSGMASNSLTPERSRFELKALSTSTGIPVSVLAAASQEIASSQADFPRRQCKYGSARKGLQNEGPKLAVYILCFAIDSAQVSWIENHDSTSSIQPESSTLIGYKCVHVCYNSKRACLQYIGWGLYVCLHALDLGA